MPSEQATLVGQLKAAIEASARTLDGSETADERDLQRVLPNALESVGAKVASQRGIKLKGWFGQLGAVDVALAEPEGDVLVELKWGDLPACSWDTVKLATALAEGEASSAFLIAGASRRAWDNHDRGVEFFASRPWRLGPLLADFAQDFAKWRTDVENRPLKLAAEWTMVSHEQSDRAQLTVGGVPHDIRLVEITVTEECLLPVVYAPVVAKWRRGLAGAVDIPRDPAAQELRGTGFHSSKDAEKLSGPTTLIGGGEGFSVEVASLHSITTNEGVLGDEEGIEELINVRRFSSPTARRTWLISRKLIDGLEPEVFAIHETTPVGSVSEITFSQRQLSLFQKTQDDLFEEKFAPDTSEWARFWGHLDAINVWDWWPLYEDAPNANSDGQPTWRVSIAKGGRMVESFGRGAAFPSRGQKVDGPSAEWHEFLLALSRLCGFRGIPGVIPDVAGR